LIWKKGKIGSTYKFNDIKERENNMKHKIDKPRVFISYAWGSQNYQNKVLAFASSLRNDGIDVVLDKWDLSEGNDTYAFMEQCVTDDTITNVLMLIDPMYTKKADEISGVVLLNMIF